MHLFFTGYFDIALFIFIDLNTVIINSTMISTTILITSFGVIAVVSLVVKAILSKNISVVIYQSNPSYSWDLLIYAQDLGVLERTN